MVIIRARILKHNEQLEKHTIVLKTKMKHIHFLKKQKIIMTKINMN